MDTPPILGPGEKPTPAALAKLARELLREQTNLDPPLAEKLWALERTYGPPVGSRWT
jgi:hypothetical protein